MMPLSIDSGRLQGLHLMFSDTSSLRHQKHIQGDWSPSTFHLNASTGTISFLSSSSTRRRAITIRDQHRRRFMCRRTRQRRARQCVDAYVDRVCHHRDHIAIFAAAAAAALVPPVTWWRIGSGTCLLLLMPYIIKEEQTSG